MAKEFNEKNLELILNNLDRMKRLAFAILCCERLYPTYILFEKKSKWGDPKVIRNAINQSWLVLRGKETSETITDLMSKCEEVTPNTEDHDNIYVSFALNSAVATKLLLALVRKDTSKIVVEIASLCIDTIDLHVQELENMSPQDPHLEEKILNHVLMQKEISQQYDDIEYLTKKDFSNPSEIEILESRHGDQSIITNINNKTFYINSIP